MIAGSVRPRVVGCRLVGEKTFRDSYFVFENHVTEVAELAHEEREPRQELIVRIQATDHRRQGHERSSHLLFGRRRSAVGGVGRCHTRMHAFFGVHIDCRDRNLPRLSKR